MKSQEWIVKTEQEMPLGPKYTTGRDSTPPFTWYLLNELERNMIE